MYGGQRGGYVPHYRQAPPYRQASPAPPFLQPPSAPQHQLQPCFVPLNSNQAYLQPPPLPSSHLPPPPLRPIQTSGNALYPVAGRLAPVQLPPPPPRVFHPAPQPNPQPHGQVLYPNLHPSLQPPWPTNMPNPNFNWTLPTPFTGKSLVTEVYPPVIPPPSPPPPPSSPPPLPPSPPDISEDALADSSNVSTVNSKVCSEALDFDSSKECIDAIVTPTNPHLPPVLPEENVVRNIEALCELIVKSGPDVESDVRVKEAGNPHFEFLFGGEPGSLAAIGHEYFIWMKKKIAVKMENLKDDNIETLPMCKDDTSLQFRNLEHVDLAHSPAISDMDMEDDITPSDIRKVFNNMNKESTVSVHTEILVASGACSPLNAEDEQESSVFEDVSPERGSPDSAGPHGSAYEPICSPAHDSFPAKPSTNTEGIKYQEAFDGALNYISPFRLLQDYASDESEENAKNGDDEGFKPVSPSPAVSNSAYHSPSNNNGDEGFKPVSLSPAVSNSAHHSPSNGNDYEGFKPVSPSPAVSNSAYHSPSIPHLRSPGKLVPSISSDEFDPTCNIIDSAIVEKELSDGRELLVPFSERDAMDERETNVDPATEFSLSEKPSPPSYDVDEFGRLIRKGVPGSDSDESRYGEKHKKWGRSRSLSHSPQGIGRRRKSRSPWRRDNRSRSRSHSRSRSPKRARNRSPPSFRTNVPVRRGNHNVPHECFNFNRGRCLYGASCRFLHNDFDQHPNRQQRVQDVRKARYSDRHDDSFSPRISRRESDDLIEEPYEELVNKEPSDIIVGDNSIVRDNSIVGDNSIERDNSILKDNSIERERPGLLLDHLESSHDRSPIKKDQPDARASSTPPTLTGRIDNSSNIAAEATGIENFSAHSFSHNIISIRPLPPPPHFPNQSLFSSSENVMPSPFPSAHMPYLPRPFLTPQLVSNSALQFNRPPFSSFEHSQLHHQQNAAQSRNDFSSSVFYPQAFNFMPLSYPHSGIHLHNPQSTVNLSAASSSIHPSIVPSDISLPRFSVREHFNPFAATFEQPLREAVVFRPNTAPIVGTRPEFMTERILSKTIESSSEAMLNSKKKFVVGAQYDPLFDSIDPFPDALRAETSNPGANGTSKLNLHKKAEAYELGEVVATEADAGGVENESPQLVDKEWSPAMPFDEGDPNVGEIEISLARTPTKSKKNKESRSARLFKIALAEFAKEVLKPSWRQGNLSKEAFKTIVKKTVDKVSGAVPSHQIPKSQAKINLYVESSQRKLTKLVLGYVDKYVKM